MVTSAQLAEAQRLRTQLEQAARDVRRFCSSANFQGDRAACVSSAEGVDAFLAPASSPAPRGGFARLLASAQAGDDDAYRRLITSGSRILVAVTGVPFELRDVTATGLAEQIARDARDAAGEIGVGIGAGAVVAAVVAVLVFVGKGR